MNAPYAVACDTCGWAGAYTSQAKANYALRRHSCTRQIALRERAERAAARSAAVDRTPKPCLHPIARHEHGTYAAYTLDKCRCHPCVAAAVDYERTRLRRIAYGRWQPYVPAEPARQHVRALMSAGVGLKRIATLTGVPQGTLWKLIYGKTRTGGDRRRTARVRQSTHDELLALRPTLDNLSGRAHVDGTGTRRRLQALVALGWSQAQLAARLGMNPSTLSRIIDTDRPVRAATARAVRDLYRELSDRQPPQDTHRQRGAVARARNHAKARGWLVPAWWDDDTIDDPATRPGPDELDVRRDHGTHTRSLIEDAGWLAGQGLDLDEIATQLGVKTDSLIRAHRRAGVELPETLQRRKVAS